MENNIIKCFVIGIILLFVGASIIPIISGEINHENKIKYFNNLTKVFHNKIEPISETIIISPSSKDSYVDRWEPDTNFCGLDYLKVSGEAEVGVSQFTYINIRGYGG